MGNSMGLIIFFVIALVTSTVFHFWLKRFWLAVILATLSSVVLFQVVVYIDLGYFDSLITIAILTTLLVALAISIFIGLLIKKYRKKAKIFINKK